jgi:thiopeptide-type bacteriocin biosynthesis protein
MSAAELGSAQSESTGEARRQRIRSWQSYHVFLPGSVDLFLVQYLPGLLNECLRARLFRRFFFIRYSEGGDHVRLRFMPNVDGAERELRIALDRAVTSCARELHRGQFDLPGEPFRIEQHLYSRQTLYFGETLQSVYAELLNEATSWLCLRLLRSLVVADRVRRWLALAATLDLVLREAYRTDDALRRAILESRDFARRAASDLAAVHGSLTEVERWTDLEPPIGRRLPLRAIWNAAARIAGALGSEPSVQRIASGLRRLARYTPEVRFVGVHSLHLLCNKLGFSLADEYWAFSALYELALGASAIDGDVQDEPRSNSPRLGHPTAQDWKQND